MFQRLLLRRRRRLMLIFGILLAVLIVVSIAGLLSRDSGASEPAIAGITCERERLDFHIHVRLSIFVNGQRREVPEGVGIRDGCLYWLHTHDASGLVHIEAPSPVEFRLGQFFAVWGEPLGERRLLDAAPEAGLSVRTLVDGNLYQGDPADVPLTDGEVIVLQYGPSLNSSTTGNGS